MSQTPGQEVLDKMDFLRLWVTSGNYLNGLWLLDVNWSMFFNTPYIRYTACQINMAALGHPHCVLCTAGRLVSFLANFDDWRRSFHQQIKPTFTLT